MDHPSTVPEALPSARPDRLGQLSIVVPGLVGLFLAWLPLLVFHDSFASYSYDGSVYIGASIRLAHGVFPYRDFVLVQPPGITVLLLPIAFLSRITGTQFALSLSHVVTLLVMGVNCSLVAFALRYRGALASFVGGMTLTLFAWSMTDDFTVKLEPFLMFFCLLAIVIAFSQGRLVTGKRVLWVGAALGVAGTVKIWAIFPALVILALYALRQRKDIGRFCVGLLVGFGVPTLPFIWAAPRAFLHDVIVSEMTRGSSTFVSQGSTFVSFGVVNRLTQLSNDAFGAIFSGRPWVGAVIVILIVATYALRWRSVSQFEWFNLVALFVAVTVLLAPAEFLTYFVYFPEVFFALVLGGVATAWASALGRYFSSLADAPVTTGEATTLQVARGAILIAVLVLVAASIPGVVNTDRSYTAFIQYVGPIGLIDSEIPPGSCVVTDFPYMTIAADRFVPANSGCPALADPDGTWVAANPAHPSPSPAYLVPGLTTDWLTWFAAADYVILAPVGNQLIPWTPSLQSFFNVNFVRVGSSGSVTIYKNRSSPIG